MTYILKKIIEKQDVINNVKLILGDNWTHSLNFGSVLNTFFI